MTYIYRFTIKETHECYVGQHRTTITDNPYKDTYKGSGKEWKQLLKLYDLWEIDKFNKGVEKEILKVWYDDVSREEVGLAEKEAIEQTRELYQGLFSDFCINIADGSLPSWTYDTQEEAELAIKECKKEWYIMHKEYYKKYAKQYYENNKEQYQKQKKQYRENHKEELKEYDKQYRENHKEEYKEYRETHKDEIKQYKKQYYETHKDEIKQYRQLLQGKLSHKINTWIHKNNYPSPETAIFPKKWGEAEITEYKRQYNNYLLKTS